MNGLRLEQRTASGAQLPVDLAEHISNSLVRGRVVVVTRDPTSLLSRTRKQWMKLLRKTDVAMASTLNPVRLQSLDEMSRRMREASFSPKVPDEVLEVDVTFGRPEELLRLHPECRTIYFVEDLPMETMSLLTAWMPRDSVVVLYG